MEEHTLNLMLEAPTFYNVFVPVDPHVHTHSHTDSPIHTHTRACICTHAVLLKHKTQKPVAAQQSVLGKEVIGLHGEHGKKSDVQCIYYA